MFFLNARTHVFDSKGLKPQRKCDPKQMIFAQIP